MSTEIRYRLKKEKDSYLNDKQQTRGFTLIHSDKLPIKVILQEFYASVNKPCVIHNIKKLNWEK
tara:strand:+ start:910 stop:1101 length:192 start_codon:yes stop_codon:yes gene_type:complete